MHCLSWAVKLPNIQKNPLGPANSSAFQHLCIFEPFPAVTVILSTTFYTDVFMTNSFAARMKQNLYAAALFKDSLKKKKKKNRIADTRTGQPTTWDVRADKEQDRTQGYKTYLNWTNNQRGLKTLSDQQSGERQNWIKAALWHFWNFALGVPLQLGYSIVFYYCRKIFHGYTRGFTCAFVDKWYPRGRSSHILGRFQCCMWNVFIPGTLAYIS